MKENDCTPSLSKAVRMKELQSKGKLESDAICKLLSEPKANQRENLRELIKEMENIER